MSLTVLASSCARVSVTSTSVFPYFSFPDNATVSATMSSSALESTSLRVLGSVLLTTFASVSASFLSSASARTAPSASANVSVLTPACSLSRNPQCPVRRSFPRSSHRRVIRKCLGFYLCYCGTRCMNWYPALHIQQLTSSASIFASVSAGVSTTALACILPDVLLSVSPEPLLPRESISILTSFSLSL